MGRVKASIAIAALASEAEALWYDTTRWATFIDGLHHIARMEGDWPHAGARVLWDSAPGGRGRVQERVLAYVAREGQTIAVEDEKIHGTQRVRFTPTEAGVIVTLELELHAQGAAPRHGARRPAVHPPPATRVAASARCGASAPRWQLNAQGSI